MVSGGSGEHQPPKRRLPAPAAAAASSEQERQQQRKMLRLSVRQGDQDDDAMTAGVVPPVTVVLDGRSICHRVHLSRHTGYRSLAAALRRMFVDEDDDGAGADGDRGGGLDLSNAVPGHLVAYEDMENDLLLAGDLSWKDFVRVVRRIRIIPVKPSSRRKPQLTAP
ncbi:auxin-responsive protein IAA33 [Oryza brachyantha]|uniref:Auxin-responsive protein n=1 Tax=Oryza brachyantha TaxID=4533 RepID=J3M251_ORYBR|nr:auxin-responsive protein IAA33 [Oryza brachyantha]